MGITNQLFIDYLISKHQILLPGVGLHGQLVQFVDFERIKEWISDPEILVAVCTNRS